MFSDFLFRRSKNNIILPDFMQNVENLSGSHLTRILVQKHQKTRPISLKLFVLLRIRHYIRWPTGNIPGLLIANQTPVTLVTTLPLDYV